MRKQRTIVGFTGTRRGMTGDQAATVHRLLQRRIRNISYVHHGDCVGSDEQMHAIALMMQLPVVLHPPVNDTYRANCQGADLTYKPMPYIQRNHLIVRTSDLLIAAPKEYHEITRSGTWATVRYARRKGKEIYVVYPDGTVKHEEKK